jgi:leucine efflux protein
MSAALLVSFIVASFLVVVAPGPATLFILRRCGERLSEPIKGVAGIVVGDVVLIGLACLGVATLVMRFPELAGTMKLTGAAYVAWLGWQALRSPPAATASAEQGLRGSFAQGFALTLSNPKPILFFAAFFPLFMTADQPAGLQFARLGALFEAVNLAFYAVFIGAARPLLRRLQPHHSAAVNAVSGAGLLAAGILGGAVTLVELGR